MFGWTPRVYGGSPGKPSLLCASHAARSSGVYRGWIGMRDDVSNASRRSGERSRALLSAVDSHWALSAHPPLLMLACASASFYDSDRIEGDGLNPVTPVHPVRGRPT